MLSRRLISAGIPLTKSALGLNSPASAMMIQRLAHHGPPAHYKHPTMDEMPVPCGSWQENYDNYQRKYNITLLFGTGFFIITVLAITLSGQMNFYFYPPDRPAERK